MSREHLDLNGTWKFCPAFVELEANQRFMNPDCEPSAPEPSADTAGPWVQADYDDAGWMDIPVPASWNKACDDLWSYEGHGWYRLTTHIPDAWKGRRVEFVSDGANYATILYVNGLRAGEHEGGYNPFSIPVHDLLRFGADNTLAVSVDNIPGRERCPGGQFDWWNHGGLYRSVRLEATNRTYLDDVVVITEPGDPVSVVDIQATVLADGVTPVVLQVHAILRDADECIVAEGQAPVEFAAGRADTSVALAVQNAALWTPDNPVLYGLSVELRDPATRACVDVRHRRVGIRCIRVDGSRLLVNGRPFTIKGLSRYEDYPDTGRTPDDVACRRDLEIIKDLGGNTIRSHYPHSPATYDLCDELGMFFVSEVPLYQWGRPAVETDAPEALTTAKEQLREMIRWQRSHPCVLMWSVSNETMCKPRTDTDRDRELADMVVAGNRELVSICHQMDPTRPAIEVSNCWPGDRVLDDTDISAVNVYIGASTPHIDTLHELAEKMHVRLEALRTEQPEKPILISEFGSWCIRGLKTDHFPGEAYQAALLKTYWEAIEKEEQVIGGLIWCFADSDVHRRFQWVYEYRCSYGIVDLHRRPKDACETIRRMWSR